MPPEPVHGPTAADPLVSVLVPAWNAADTIGRALRSILDDPRDDLEVIVVDDGSTDATVAVAESVAATDPRVRVLAGSGNEGVSAARNRGLQAVRGTWLTHLDADDRILPGGLAALCEPALRGDALVVVGQRVWSDGARTWISALYDIPDIRQPGRKSVATHPGLMYYASATGKLFHRSTWEGLEFYARVLGDQPWTIRAMLRAGERLDVIGADVYEWSRPAPGTPGASITSVTRAAAASGVEAAGVATRALADVAAEADALLAPDAARGVRAAYAERLIRSDLARHLAGALRRRDAGTASILDAIEAFLASAPAGAVAGSRALAEDVLEPAVAYWMTLDADGRAAARSLVARSAREGWLPASGIGVERSALRRIGAGGAGATLAVGLVGAIAATRRLGRKARRRLRRG